MLDSLRTPESAVNEVKRVFTKYNIDPYLRVAEVREMAMNERGSVNMASAVLEELQRRMPEAPSNDIDDLNEIVQAVSELVNTTPHFYTLGGLSPLDIVQWEASLAKRQFIVPETFYVEADVVHDLEVYLSVIDAEKPLLTKVNHELPRKIIYAINERLRKPQILDEELGGHMYRLQEERQARTVHLLNIVTKIAGLTKVRHNRLTLTKTGQAFRSASAHRQYELFLETVLTHLNWGYACYSDYDYEIAQAIQAQTSIFLYRLAVHSDLRNIIRVKDFAYQVESICRMTPDDKLVEKIDWVLQHTILWLLEYSGILVVKEQQGSHGLEQVMSYEPTPGGMLVLVRLAYRA